MKRIISLVIAVAMITAMLVIPTSAAGANPAGGCKLVTTIKQTDPIYVVKDGIIGENEYEKVELNLDPATTDLHLGWDGAGKRTQAEEFLKTIEFYISWDSVHGFNCAIKCKPLETPTQLGETGGDPNYADSDFPADEFLFQLGAMIDFCSPDYDESGNPVLSSFGHQVYSSSFYRGFSRNTETGEYVMGYYAQHGLNLEEGENGVERFEAGKNLAISYSEDGYVTYEISCDFEWFLELDVLENGAPKEGTEIYYDVATVAGGVGSYHNDCASYAVSIGDYGFLSSASGMRKGNPAPTKGIFTNDTITDITSVNASFSDEQTVLTLPGEEFTAPEYTGDSFDGFTFEGWSATEVTSAATKPAATAAGGKLTVDSASNFYALFSIVEDGDTFYTTKPENGTHFKHDFTELKSDASGHWYKCTKCDAAEAVQAHDFTVAKSDEANHWNDCSICGYSDTKVAHDFSVVKYDDDGHWTECACGYNKGDKAAHIQGDAVDAKHPTDSDPGYTAYACTGEGCEYVIYGEFVSHVYTVPNFDDNNHWMECSCGEVGADTVTPHTFAQKSDATDHWQGCDCGAIKDKAAHSFTEAKKDADSHWNDCSVCGASDTKVAHDFSAVEYDDNGHWTVCACGTQGIESTAHTKGETVEVVEPKDEEQGYTVYKCGFAGCEAQFKADFVDPVKIEDVFSDIIVTEWYYDGIDYAYKNGLMNGKPGGIFDPEAPMTRAELVTVLWRQEGAPEVQYKDTFTDLKDDWYKSPILWAAENGIVNGVGDGLFDPDGELTREQLATILYRYTGEYKEGDVSAKGDISVFPDADKVSMDWAYDAVVWAVGEGLINGTSDFGGPVMLAPGDSTTRAQIATIMMRYNA